MLWDRDCKQQEKFKEWSRAWRIPLKVLSQILAVVGVSASQEEFIFTAFKKLSISPQPKEDLEISLDSSCLSTKDIEKSCAKSDGEHPTKPEIEELSPSPTTSLVCIVETNYPCFPCMNEEDFQSGTNEEMGQCHQDYIEHWFQITIHWKYHSHLPILFISHLSKLIISHALVHANSYILNLSMNISLYMIYTWLHWKFSFTWRSTSFL